MCERRGWGRCQRENGRHQAWPGRLISEAPLRSSCLWMLRCALMQLLLKKKCVFSRSKNMLYVGVLDLMGRIEEVARRKRREALGPRKGWKGDQSSFASPRSEGAVQSRKCKHSWFRSDFFWFMKHFISFGYFLVNILYTAPTSPYTLFFPLAPPTSPLDHSVSTLMSSVHTWFFCSCIKSKNYKWEKTCNICLSGADLICLMSPFPFELKTEAMLMALLRSSSYTM